jgi:hypothetical protein
MDMSPIVGPEMTRRLKGRPASALPARGELKLMTLQLPGELYLSVYKAALERNTSVSAVFRDAVRHYLEV